MDLTTRTDDEIQEWIKNHERAPDGTMKALYHQLLEERARRSQAAHRLNFEKSLEHLKLAAIRQECTSYAELANASGVEWSKARHQMNGPSGHLDRLVDLCHARGLPLLTAICVNQANVMSGELGDAALAGFVAAAKRIGTPVTDDRAFHRQCRDECWRWGKESGNARP